MGKSVLEARNRMAFNYSGVRRWGREGRAAEDRPARRSGRGGRVAQVGAWSNRGRPGRRAGRPRRLSRRPLAVRPTGGAAPARR
ncbi:hypothetical protein C6Q02_09055 [Burkholderia multivorans]|nr:hypothetical protein C6Q02_09055 [Burkholderia multivorans]